MSLFALTLALLALLATPGPTNALLALAGARGGLAAALRLVPVVLAAYLVVVVPLTLWGAPLVAQLPMLRPVVTGLAALWVARLAVKLWHLPPVADVGAVSPGALGLTTLLNPKGLIVGLVLLPAHPAPGAALAAFALAVTLASLLWAALGAGVLSRAGGWLNRGSALWLAGLSLLLAARAFAG